jgi:hypothetical protein
VSRRVEREQFVNEADLHFFAADPKKDPPPPAPFSIPLPRGYATWTACWLPGGSTLWIARKQGDQTDLTAYDFSDPKAIRETAAEFGRLPPEVQQAFRPTSQK